MGLCIEMMNLVVDDMTEHNPAFPAGCHLNLGQKATTTS
jgi:hypothetical protein